MDTSAGITYKPLEQDYLNKIADGPISFDVSTSFGDVSIFLFTTFFAVIVAAAFGKYVMAGVYRIQASEAGIRKSNETIKRVTLGLLGVFGLFLVLYTVNRGFLESDINLDGLRIGGGVVSGGNNPVVKDPNTTNQDKTNKNDTSLAICPGVDLKAFKSSLTDKDGICSKETCTILSNCDTKYFKTIKELASAQGVDYKIVIVAMCKESGGRMPIKPNENKVDGKVVSVDCGIMQINRGSGCLPSDNSPDQTQNIKDAIQLIKDKISVTSTLTPGVPSEAKLFASYNCCGTDPLPNTPSSDCKSSDGFSDNFPRWACPINPGGMCTVKSYACETFKCLSSPKLNNI